MNLETIRFLILIIGWPILIAGSIWSLAVSYKFYRDVHKSIYGKLVLIMVLGWLVTMYSLGITATGFMLADLQLGVTVVMPIFLAWFVTMVVIFIVIVRWNKEAVVLSNFYAQIEQDRDMIASERNKLAVVLASMRDMVVAVDTSYNILLFNKAAEILTGYTSKEVGGKHIDQVIKIFDKETNITANAFCLTPANPSIEAVFSKKNLQLVGVGGKVVIVDMMVAIIKGQSKGNLGWVITYHDVTQEQQLEKMKLDFISMAAHELRTPLTVIRGYADLLFKQYSSNPDPEYHQVLKNLISGCDSLTTLANDLLSASRIEKGEFTLNLRPVDLLDLIQKVKEDFSGQAQAKGQQLLLINPSEQLPLVLADQQRIIQVATNLLSNAIAYTQPGGKITISLHRQNTSQGKQGDFIGVSISDTGIGIPSEAMSHLFTKYFKVGGSLNRGSRGTGLGLFITKSIISLHNGDIWAQSQVGKGSAFTFTIPIAIQEALKMHQDE